MTASVLSVNVGLPRDVEWEGRRVRTGIFKSPVAGPVRVRKLKLEGDGQADHRVHGGEGKAVYAYPSEHYGAWRGELERPDLGWGAFGENLTMVGLSEASVRIGDRLRIGSVELVVTRPRLPCYKLDLRFARADMIPRMLRSGRTGFYCSVAREGELAAGDAIEVLVRSDGPTVAEVVAGKAGREAPGDGA